MNRMIMFLTVVSLTALFSCSKDAAPPNDPVPTDTIPLEPFRPVYWGEDTLLNWNLVHQAGNKESFGFVQFPTKNVGYLTNQYYFNVVQFKKTTDGGKTWSDWKNLPTYTRKIQFITEKVGFAYKPEIEGSPLWQTIDNGTSWIKRFTSDKMYTIVKHIDFLNDTTGYAITMIGECLKITYPAENAAFKVKLLGSVPTELVNIYSLSFPDLKHGWCVAGDDNLQGNSMIFCTTDSGKTWKLQTEIQRTKIYNCYFADAQHGIASTGSNTFFRTTDGGTTWSKVTITKADQSAVRTHKMIFVSPQRGFMLSTNEILETTDGGLTWRRSMKDGSNNLYDLYWTKPNTLYALSDKRLFSLTF